MGEVKQINIKIKRLIFTTTQLISKTLLQVCEKLTKNHTKTLVFTSLDKLQLNIYSVNLLYLLINHANGYIEEQGVNKYLTFDSTHENKELLKKYNDVWNGIGDKIKEVSSCECDYEKEYMKIKLNSGDNLPLSKPLKFHNMTITIRSVFEKDGKLYPQDFLDDTLYELNV